MLGASLGLALGICPKLGTSLARIYLLAVAYVSLVVQFHQFNYVLVLEPAIPPVNILVIE